MTSDATTFDPARLDEMTAQEFASFVGSMSDAQIQSTLGGEHRSAVLDWLFGGVPEHFRPERADGGSARIHFRITGGAQPDPTYAIVVSDGQCTSEKDPTAEPGASLMLGLTEFLRLITGTANPMTMVMFGKLKVRGELPQVLAFQKWFDMPRA